MQQPATVFSSISPSPRRQLCGSVLCGTHELPQASNVIVMGGGGLIRIHLCTWQLFKGPL
jgi:hypothetical protein